MIIKLDYKSEMPIYLQLRNEIIRGIGQGALKFGDQLPTVRSLAADIGVNAMTVSKAYALLKNQGYIITDRRRGTLICAREDMPLKAGGDDLAKELELIASEAALGGCTKDAFLDICSRIYPQLD